MKALRPIELRKPPVAGSFAGLFNAPENHLNDAGHDAAAPSRTAFDIDFGSSVKHRSNAEATVIYREAQAAAPLRVGLIDCYRFSQEALVKAFEGMQPQLSIVPFATMQECIGAAPAGLDVVIFYAHAMKLPAAAVASDLLAFRESGSGIPVIVMSDAEDGEQQEMLRCAFGSGVRGFIPARTTGIPMTMAIMAFVKAGGTYAPVDLLLCNDSDALRAPEPTAKGCFTSRQTLVLAHLKQGKANKTIAYELGMSESTVKVHVRNIMRAMGATNRTQAAYNAQQMLSRETSTKGR